MNVLGVYLDVVPLTIILPIAAIDFSIMLPFDPGEIGCYSFCSN